MEAIINGVRYRVANSTELASDQYWDGHGFERDGRNVFLYHTPTGRYFAVHLTMWEKERDYIEPLEEDAAMELYEDLPMKVMPVEQAFPNVRVVEA